MTDTPRKQYVAPAHFCAACRKRGKTWDGSDPKCAFPNGGPFTPDNWNCATAGMIRDMAGDWWTEPPPKGIRRHQEDDQTYITIYTHEVEFDALYGPGNSDLRWCLWVTWYKRRGRTGNMVLLGAEECPTPRPPTEADVLAILAYYDPAQQPGPLAQAEIDQMNALRDAFMSEAVEIEPGIHMLELGGKDDDIPF